MSYQYPNKRDKYPFIPSRWLQLLIIFVISYIFIFYLHKRPQGLINRKSGTLKTCELRGNAKGKYGKMKKTAIKLKNVERYAQRVWE